MNHAAIQDKTSHLQLLLSAPDLQKDQTHLYCLLPQSLTLWACRYWKLQPYHKTYWLLGTERTVSHQILRKNNI